MESIIGDIRTREERMGNKFSFIGVFQFIVSVGGIGSLFIALPLI